MTDDDDFDALNAGNPMAGYATFVRGIARSSDPDAHWFVGLLDSDPVGFAYARSRPAAAGGYGTAIIAVRPAARRHGVATALRDAVEHACRDKVPGVVYRGLGGDDDTEATIAAWALEIGDRSIESVLDLTTIDRDAFERMAAAPGTAFRTAADFDDEQWRTTYAFVAARFSDTPDMAGSGGPPYEMFRSMVREPWMLMLAEDDGRLVGVTFVVARDDEPNSVDVALTGVLPAERGRGIAVALKAKHALTFQQHGVTRTFTQNIARNAPIRAVNRRMGYVEVAEHLLIRQAF